MGETANFVLNESGDKCWDEGVSLENFSHSADSSFPETLYMSVGDQTTEYYSVLEQSGEEILNDIADIGMDSMKDLNVTLVPEQNDEVLINTNDNAMIFTVKGSNSLFGIQEVQDNEGNIQKYQFEVNQNENGEFEAIPGTFQLVQMQSEDEEEQEEEIDADIKNAVEDDQSEAFLNEERFENVTYFDENSIVEDKDYEDQDEEEWSSDVDTKEDIIVKEFKVNIQEDNLPEKVEENLEEPIETYEEEMIEESSTATHTIINFEENTNEVITAEEMHVNEFTNFLVEEDSLNSGVHIVNEPTPTPIPQKRNIHKCSTKNVILFQKKREKENFIDHSINSNNKKVNPRSILKVSHIPDKREDVYNKRFAKGKTATLRRQFDCYISKTTIPEAPIRNERLPRKQKINPVTRDNEEIIMQQIVVSSNGYIETLEDGVLRERELLKPSACILISDSDEDSRPRQKKRKRKKSIDTYVISDTDEDDICIVAPPQTLPKNISIKVNPKKRSKSKNTQCNYSCDICKSEFSSIVLLKTHINFHKLNKKLPSGVQCNKCKRRFDTYFKLSQHKRIHNKLRTKNDSSQVKTPTKKHNNSPYIVRSTGKKFKCVNCSSNFSSKIFLEKHFFQDCVKIKRPIEISDKT